MKHSRFGALAMLLVAAIALSACSAGQPSGTGAPPAGSTQSIDLVKVCQVAQAVYDGTKALLDAKCAADTAKGKDPLSNGYCLGSAGGGVAVQACFAAADKGDAAGVQTAKADIQDAAAKVAAPAT